MRLRNAARAAGLLLAVVALLVPASANGEQLWWFDHDEGRFPVSTKKKEVKPSLLNVTITDKKGKKIEKCNIEIVGFIHSKFGGMGEGTLEKSEGKPESCKTDIAECAVTVEPLMSTAWGLTLETGKKVTISNFKLTVELKGSCPETEFPKESTISATVKASFADYDSETGAPGRVIFNGGEGLAVGGTEVFLDGFLGFGTKVTALPEPQGFTATTSPAKIDGTALVSPILTWSSGRTVQCGNSTLTSTAENGHDTIFAAPVYSGCMSNGTQPATIKMNGCEYLLHLNAENQGEEKYKYTATTDVACPVGKEIEIDIFSNHTNHTAGTPVLCRYAIGETGNQGLSIVELTNESAKGEPSWVEAHVNIGEIVSKRIAGSVLVCGALETKAILEEMYELTGTVDEGEGSNGIAVFPPE